MTPEAFIQQKAAAAIQAIYNTEVAPGSLQVAVTRKEFEGDYTLVTFPLLKITRQAPDATGNAIGLWLVANVPEIAAYNSVKGFLNLSFSPVYWNEALQGIAADDAFGQLPSTGKRIMVEFSSPNTNKPLHLGHIRNNLLGDSVSRILKACGNEVIKSTIVNDRGVHICKSMYAWEKCFNGATPESTGKKGDHLVGDCYVAYAKMEKEHPEVIDDVHKMLVDWEAGDPHVRELWAMMNGWVYKGFDETYAALGISFDQVDHESETYLLGKELVQKGLQEGVFVKDPDGSVWCDLTADGLDRKLVLRGDGTSVYITQDLGTAERRFANFKLDSHVYVVGNEQDYHFQVLKLILKKLGFAWADQIYHLSYGMVELPEGKMKSREGCRRPHPANVRGSQEDLRGKRQAGRHAGGGERGSVPHDRPGRPEVLHYQGGSQEDHALQPQGVHRLQRQHRSLYPVHARPYSEHPAQGNGGLRSGRYPGRPRPRRSA